MSKKPHTSAQTPSVFISYRRADTEGHAGRLSDSLKEHFGERVRVFMDFEAIPAGEDFVKVIQDAVGSCHALVAVIGRQWLSVADAKTGTPRLANPRDHVRAEIASALKRGVRVIPVLVQGAAMPAEEELPEDLKPLANRNALEVSGSRWEYDVQTLVRALESSLPASTAPEDPPRARGGLAALVAGIPLPFKVVAGLVAAAALVLLVAQRDRTPPVTPRGAETPTPNVNAGAATPNGAVEGGGEAGGEDLMVLSSVISNSSPAVVRINTTSADGTQSYSTGFIVTREGHILTADYVAAPPRPGAQGAARHSVTMRDGSAHAASLVNVSADAGLALLKIGPGDYRTISVAEADPAPRARVVVLGAIGGGDVVPVFGTVRGTSGKFLEIVYDVSGGSAGGGGGPVLNSRGEAVGISHSATATVRQCVSGSVARGYLRAQGITR
jgi:hypothetical protein